MRTTELINRSQAILEAQRCLGCHDAPCMQACPAKVAVPLFIRRFREGNLEGAGEALYDACPLAATCGLACPTMVLCEGACVLRAAKQNPVRIGALQAHIAGQYFRSEPGAADANPGRIAVVGGGPAGIGCAVSLRRLGHAVDVFDRQEFLGGLVDRVIPPHRLPGEVVAWDLSRLAKSGIHFKLGQDIDPQRFAQLQTEYNAVFVGVGLSAAETLAVPCMQLQGVVAALDYLEQARRYTRNEADPPDLGDCVVVIGGGNVALDAAVTAKRLSAGRVIVLYRRSMTEMPGWETEYLEAASLGVEFRWLSTVERILGTDGKVSAVMVVPMRFTATEKGGRRWVESDPDAQPYALLCDAVLVALGQKLEREFAQAAGLTVNGNGVIETDEHTFRTSLPKVFSAGESASGGATIVYCLSRGMAAGRAIDRWLKEEKE